jgi:hypothetical protein
MNNRPSIIKYAARRLLNFFIVKSPQDIKRLSRFFVISGAIALPSYLAVFYRNRFGVFHQTEKDLLPLLPNKRQDETNKI